MVDADVLETDGEQFDCSTCALAAAQAGLRPENAEAWRVYGQIARRFIVDAGLGSHVMTHCLAGRDAEDALDLMDRLALIYDELVPPSQDP